MTRLQMAWTNLLDSGMTFEAHDLLLDIYPRVLREDLPEITSLLQETFQVESAKGRQLVGIVDLPVTARRLLLPRSQAYHSHRIKREITHQLLQ